MLCCNSWLHLNLTSPNARRGIRTWKHDKNLGPVTHYPNSQVHSLSRISHPEQPVVCDYCVSLWGWVLGLDPLHLSLILCVVVLRKGHGAPWPIILLHPQHNSAVASICHVDPICANVSHTGSATGKCNLENQWCPCIETVWPYIRTKQQKKKNVITWIAVLFIRSLERGTWASKEMSASSRLKARWRASGGLKRKEGDHRMRQKKRITQSTCVNLNIYI